MHPSRINENLYSIPEKVLDVLAKTSPVAAAVRFGQFMNDSQREKCLKSNPGLIFYFHEN
jgi:hypothetical protein